MAPTKQSIEDCLARVNFPLYTVQMLTSRHVIVGGGGGSAKSGVANGFEIFELSHNGHKFFAEEITRHETGPTVVMNCSVFNDNKCSYLVANQEKHCQVYKVESELVEDIENVGNNENEIRNRKKQNKEIVDKNRNSKKIKFILKPLNNVQTDFIGDEPLLRVTRIHPNGKFLVTGGTDAHIKVWHFPTLKPLNTLKGHNKEIDDLDFHENNLISVAKDGQAILWDFTTGKEVRRLKWEQPEGSKYLYKRARFGKIEGTKNGASLYMLSNPTGQARKQKSFLQCWNYEDGILKKCAEYDESLSALAIRDDGRFVAIGTMFSGSVALHIAFSLQRVFIIPGAHSMFVTGLDILSGDSHTVTSAVEAAVLSISVDNHVCIHTLPYRKTIHPIFGIFILVLALYLTFTFCSYIGI